MAVIGMTVSGPSMTYLVRIMGVLVNHVDVGVTSLAMMSRMNHKRCNVVIRWLEDSGYAYKRVFREKGFVVLTQSGREYAERLLEVKNMTHSPAASSNLYAQDNGLYYRSIGTST